MTMLDIFNINEKLSLKQLFYQLKNQIDASKILKNPDGSLKDPSTLLPYDNKEFMEVLEFEEKIQDKRKKFYSIMGNGKRLRDLMADCENEKSMFTDIDKKQKHFD